MPRGSPTRSTVGSGPSVGQEDWSKELSNHVYANVEGTTELTHNRLVYAGWEGAFLLVLLYIRTQLIPFYIQKLKC